MTKKIRIENADTSDHKVRVQVQHQMADGSWVDAPDRVDLLHPTQMTEQHIWREKRLVISEI